MDFFIADHFYPTRQFKIPTKNIESFAEQQPKFKPPKTNAYFNVKVEDGYPKFNLDGFKQKVSCIDLV